MFNFPNNILPQEYDIRIPKKIAKDFVCLIDGMFSGKTMITSKEVNDFVLYFIDVYRMDVVTKVFHPKIFKGEDRSPKFVSISDTMLELQLKVESGLMLGLVEFLASCHRQKPIVDISSTSIIYWRKEITIIKKQLEELQFF